MGRTKVLELDKKEHYKKIFNVLEELKKQNIIVDFDMIPMSTFDFFVMQNNPKLRPKTTEEKDRLLHIFLKSLDVGYRDGETFNMLLSRVARKMSKYLGDDEHILIAHYGRIHMVVFYVKSNDNDILNILAKAVKV